MHYNTAMEQYWTELIIVHSNIQISIEKVFPNSITISFKIHRQNVHCMKSPRRKKNHRWKSETNKDTQYNDCNKDYGADSFSGGSVYEIIANIFPPASVPTSISPQKQHHGVNKSPSYFSTGINFPSVALAPTKKEDITHRTCPPCCVRKSETNQVTRKEWKMLRK